MCVRKLIKDEGSPLRIPCFRMGGVSLWEVWYSPRGSHRRRLPRLACLLHIWSFKPVPWGCIHHGGRTAKTCEIEESVLYSYSCPVHTNLSMRIEFSFVYFILYELTRATHTFVINGIITVFVIPGYLRCRPFRHLNVSGLGFWRKLSLFSQRQVQGSKFEKMRKRLVWQCPSNDKAHFYHTDDKILSQ